MTEAVGLFLFVGLTGSGLGGTFFLSFCDGSRMNGRGAWCDPICSSIHPLQFVRSFLLSRSHGPFQRSLVSQRRRSFDVPIRDRPTSGSGLHL